MATRIDVAAARAATPGCEAQAFLLSAGSSLPTQETLDAVIGHLRREAEVGGYAAADEVAGVLDQGRADLAALVGGQAGEVALSTSDTAAWVKAWWGWVTGGNVRPGSAVLVDRLSYHSHYAALCTTQSIADFEIRVMPSLPDGTIDVGAVEVDGDVGVVCTTMIGTHCGNVNPIAEVGAIAATAGVPMFLDACQALGQLRLDVKQLGCHVLTATGRKFLRAPRGTGMLWVDAALVERFRPPGIDGTSAAWSPTGGLDLVGGMARFEEYEVSQAAMVGLASAAAQVRRLGIDAIEATAQPLAEHLRTSLAGIPGVTVADTAARRCAIVTFTVDGVPPADVVATAGAAGVVINESTALWAALDMEAKHLAQVVRASPHYFNTTEEIDRLVEVMAEVARR